MFNVVESRPVNVNDTKKKLMEKILGEANVTGAGCYASVYSGNKSENTVIKVGPIGSNSGYLAFIRELSKLKEPNPYLPAINGAVLLKKGRTGVFLVSMEKLVPVYAHKQHKKALKFLDTINDVVAYEDSYHKITGNKFLQPEKLKEAIELIKRAYGKCRGEYDLHSGNIMFRNEQLVITDPLV